MPPKFSTQSNKKKPVQLHRLFRFCYCRISFRQAAAKSRSVAQEIMLQAELKVLALCIYFHFRSGMGFRMITCPASRLLS